MKTINILLTWVFITALPLYASERHSLDKNASIFVEPGDSYIKLFGYDWFRVFQANKDLLFQDKKGRLISTPEKLVVGSKLVVPAGTHLTERAMQRINRNENLRGAALEAIRKAESVRNGMPEHPSEAYRQAVDLLDKAKEAAVGLDDISFRYVEARRMAEGALRGFGISAEMAQTKAALTEINNELRQSQGQVAWGKILPYRGIGLDQSDILIVSLFAVMLSTLFCFWKNRKRKERLIRTQVWIEQHENRLAKFLKMRF